MPAAITARRCAYERCHPENAGRNRRTYRRKTGRRIQYPGRRKERGRASTEHIQIIPKQDNPGIDIYVAPGTKGEFVHIPVVVEQSGLVDLVYNDFYIGEDSDVQIVAGCGIHNDGLHLSQHDGIHTFHVGKNARVKYVEKHYGEGGGSGKRVLNPVTRVHLEEGSYLEMDTVQIEGVDSTDRVTEGTVGDGATLVVHEKLMTSGTQTATTTFAVDLNGKGSSANITSRSVAKGESVQKFLSKIHGNNACMGHSECDAIIMDGAVVQGRPGDTGRACGRFAHSRGRHWQDCGRADYEAYDAGAHL